MQAAGIPITGAMSPMSPMSHRTVVLMRMGATPQQEKAEGNEGERPHLVDAEVAEIVGEA
ncbi:MAG: hypothetical protein WDO73_19180 [Ignavibacteriota bacterium]